MTIDTQSTTQPEVDKPFALAEHAVMHSEHNPVSSSMAMETASEKTADRVTTNVIEPSIIRPIKIGIVAGEVSGDALGASLMADLNNLHPHIEWVGVGGVQMQQQGLQSLFALERLAVMGLVEVLGKLPDLFAARRELVEAFTQADIDIFIGVDAPDFNLRVAKLLKPLSIFCVQYVSPSVWAWRENRIKKIKQATHLVLCLFPFELPVYQKHAHPAVCVGHPLLSQLPERMPVTSVVDTRLQLIWHHSALQTFFANKPISQMIAVMPGSRQSEIKSMLPLMLRSVAKLLAFDEELVFIIAAVNQQQQTLIQHYLAKQPTHVQQAITVASQPDNAHFSREVMLACDMVLLASGTITLEAMLLEKPMLVVYRLNALTYTIAKRLIKIPYVALPNILATKAIVPELIQQQANPDDIARGVIKLLQSEHYYQQIQALQQTKTWLYQQSNQSAAHSVIEHWLNTNG